MRALALLRTGWLLLAMGASPLASAFAFVDPPASPPIKTTKDQFRAIEGDPTASLERGLDFERRHNWSAAVQVYRDAKEKWPSRSEFKQRLRLSEMHQRLARRYQDASFRNVLLRLPREKAFDLFDELVERIDVHYVDCSPAGAVDPPRVRQPRGRPPRPELRLPGAQRAESLRPSGSPGSVSNYGPDAINSSFPIARPPAIRSPRPANCRARSLNIPPAAVILEFVFGCCDVLDDYTAYLTPDKLDDMFAMIDGNFVGLGVELKQDDAGLKLVGVIRGGPASEAGLKPGDRIVSVGGVSVKGVGLDEAAGRLQGSEGTTVDITVLRTDSTTTTLRLIRRHVEVESVGQARIIESIAGVGYIQFTGFQKTSTEELDRAIAKLRRQGMRYLVLDLRGNPGGLLNVAVDIADRFLDQGVIVSTRGRAPGQTQVYRARPDKPYTMPVAVLIDRDSASASEILAGALQELGRAVVIGDRSYGKGSVQSIFELQVRPGRAEADDRQVLFTKEPAVQRARRHTRHPRHPPGQARRGCRAGIRPRGIRRPAE